MTSSSKAYVPVLKVKRGEKKALGLVALDLRSKVVPLLEIVERKEDKKPTVAGHLDTAFAGLSESLRGYARCFLDTREIAADGPSAAAEAFRYAKERSIKFTPVTGIARTADVDAAIANGIDGIGLRVTRDEFEVGGLAAKIETFIRSHDLSPSLIDLIIDLGSVDNLIVPGITRFAEDFISEIPRKAEWRTLVMSTCSFPMSMGVVARRSYDLVERGDWIAWRDEFYSRRDDLARLPTFSDCGIQHPAGVEGFDPRYMPVSATIRYTVPESWLLIKGESTRRTPARVQFPALATQLVYGHLRKHYAGEDHCAGCKSAKEAADGIGGYGSPEAWRRLGTVHHITTVMREMASLP